MKTSIQYYYIYILFIASTILYAQKRPTIILNAVLHVGNGKVIQKSGVSFQGGKILEVFDLNNDKHPDLNQYGKVIDAEGKHLYPGFIAPNSTLGITEIGAVRATRDYAEVGKFKPHIRSMIAFNAESKISETVKTNGVLLAQVTPRYGRITGTSSVMELDGWNWEDTTYKKGDGIHVNWPSIKDAGEKSKKQYQKEMSEMIQFFKDAYAYSKINNPKEKDLKLEAMKSVFNGEKRVYINADDIRQIIDAVENMKVLKVKYPVIMGGSDMMLAADLLKKHNIPVMIRRVHSLPESQDQDIDNPYKLAALLQKKGILFCLENSGDMEAMNTRNLPFLAGTTVAYGLTKEQALTAITLNTAKILGIDKTIGSIESGKHATMFISKGDALDMMGNRVEKAFIRGRSINLDNHQKRLFKKYSNKYK